MWGTFQNIKYPFGHEAVMEYFTVRAETGDGRQFKEGWVHYSTEEVEIIGGFVPEE